MKEKLISTVGKQIGKFPQIKKILLSFIDFFLEYKTILLGNLTRNPAYLQHIFNSKVIAKPGTFNFRGGAFNPGALMIDEKNMLLLAKSQVLPWFKARGKNRKFFLAGNPVTFLLDINSLKTKKEEIITHISGFPKNSDWAIEDMRLFWWKGKKMINHSFISTGKVGEFINQTSVTSTLSILDIKENTFTFQAFPKLDFPTQDIEKNWVYKEYENKLFLFYSLNPYKVLVLENEENFTFKTIIDQQFDWKLKNPGLSGNMVSFSTNPIDFDDHHFLIVVHQIDHKITGRFYFHWAVLVDKKTLIPVKITSKPIFTGRGARGRTPGVRYISSILKIKDEILFFAGEGDVYITVTKKPVSKIIGEMTDL